MGYAPAVVLYSSVLTSATVSDDGPGHGAVQVPEIDGTLFESEVNDEEILDEDDDVGDLHATAEADDEEDADFFRYRFC